MAVGKPRCSLYIWKQDQLHYSTARGNAASHTEKDLPLGLMFKCYCLEILIFFLNQEHLVLILHWAHKLWGYFWLGDVWT